MRCGLVISFLLIALAAQAQQLGQYTQYVFNHFSVNPAVAGSKECLDVRLGVRQQWSGFDGAPRTGWASMHGVLRPKGKPFIRNRHGIGGFVEADNAGHWGYTRFVLAYAYHLRMTQDAYISFGLFAGAQQMKFDVGNVVVVEYDDPAIQNRASVMVVPEITPGLWWYNKNAWAGVALHQAVGNRIEGIGQEARLARHFMLSGGYRYRMGPRMHLIPSMLLKKAGGSPFALDINAMAEWNKQIALGAGYRGGDAVVLLMRVGFLKYFQLGYSYDITTSRLRVAGNNTHELILGVTPCSGNDGGRRMISCPAFE